MRLIHPQDSCLGDGSGGRITLTWCRLVLLLKLTFGLALLHFDDIGAKGGFDDNDGHGFMRISWKWADSYFCVIATTRYHVRLR